MATIAATAAIRESSIRRLKAAAQRIADKTGVQPPTLPEFREPNYNQAMQLNALADWADLLAATLTPVKAEEPSTDGPDFESMKVDELRAWADEHNIDLAGATKKADIIEKLRAGAPADDEDADADPDADDETEDATDEPSEDELPDEDELDDDQPPAPENA
jgi:hypothetical protein